MTRSPLESQLVRRREGRALSPALSLSLAEPLTVTASRLVRSGSASSILSDWSSQRAPRSFHPRASIGRRQRFLCADCVARAPREVIGEGSLGQHVQDERAAARERHARMSDRGQANGARWFVKGWRRRVGRAASARQRRRQRRLGRGRAALSVRLRPPPPPRARQHTTATPIHSRDHSAPFPPLTPCVARAPHSTAYVSVALSQLNPHSAPAPPSSPLLSSRRVSPITKD